MMKHFKPKILPFPTIKSLLVVSELSTNSFVANSTYMGDRGEERSGNIFILVQWGS